MKKLFTLFAMCIAFATADAQVNYTTRTLTFEDNDYVGGNQNYLGNTTNYWSSRIDNPQYGGDLLYGENHGDTMNAKAVMAQSAEASKCMTLIMDEDVISMLTGDVPEGVTYEFTSDYTYNRNYLTNGQQYSMVIKGMPSNAWISKIEVVGYCHQRNGKAYIRAYVGSEEFASLKYSGSRVNDYGLKVGQTETTMEMTMTSESVACVDDITLHALCESENMTIKNYYIYYTLSETTGISNAETSASNDAIYNLQGIRVDNPVKGNIYIKGGKKIAY